MSSTVKIRLGGVPEHFNMPWHVCMDNGLFANKGINIDWHDYKTGTGAMLADLQNDQLDMALLLTEGAITGIAKGADVKILQWFVYSPLTWGIHTAYNSTINNIDDIFTQKYAISRLGSGSHLMTMVHAAQFGQQLQDEQFVIVNNLDGAEEALINEKASIFFWEKYTTKHLVDQLVLKRIGEFITPWPCFVWVIKNSFFEANTTIINQMQDIINPFCNDFKNDLNAISLIATKYNLGIEDVTNWIKNVTWNTQKNLHYSELENCTNTLKSLKIIPQDTLTTSLVFNN